MSESAVIFRSQKGSASKKFEKSCSRGPTHCEDKKNFETLVPLHEIRTLFFRPTTLRLLSIPTELTRPRSKILHDRSFK
jgi:hypothetical protein